MPELKLKAELTGKGAINNSYIYLEVLPNQDVVNAIPIALHPKNSARKEWNNSSISINVEGNLDLQLNVHAMMGTEWSFKLSSKSGNIWKKLYEKDGETGEDLDIGNNKSIVITSITL